MRGLWFLMALLLLAGCSSAPPPAPPVVAEAPPAATAETWNPPAVRRLFPLTPSRLRYLRNEQTPVTHEWLAEAERIAVVRPGAPPLEWRFDKMGAWLADPAAGTLLRYLPPVLEAGAVWRQGDTWFRLEDGAETCRGLSWPVGGPPACWDLAVLEEARRTRWTFAEGYGPVRIQADAWADPGASHILRWAGTEPLAGSVAYPTVEATSLPLAQGDVAGFAAALAERLGRIEGTSLDFDGDGHPERVSAGPERWVNAPLAVWRPDGALLYLSPERHGRLRATAAGDLLIVEYRPVEDRLYNTYTVLYMREGRLEPVFGWGTKSQWAMAHRFRAAEAGGLVAEFDLGDPAGHTRFTRYRLEVQDGYRRAVAQSVTYMDSGPALVYPTTPEGVLHAAFVARWFGLSEELPRYFASAEVSRSFAEHPEVTEPLFFPGTVELSAAPGSDGWATFTATWGFYEASTKAHGRVRFSTDATGRPVILELHLDRFEHSSV